MTARPYLLCALALMLTSCASLRKPEIAFAPVKIDCAIFDSPKVNPPADPPLSAKDVAVWQLWGLGWQAVAEHLLDQRVESAQCVAKLRDVGIVK